MKPVRYFLLITVILFISACGKDSCYQVSNVTFNTLINRAEHQAVYVAGGVEYANGGVCGLIVYNTGSGLIAYDRCSTVEASQGSRVEVEGFTIIDPVSGAKWLLTDGSPAEIAECSLWRYHVSPSGDNYYVRN